MKAKDIHVGGTYAAKVSGVVVRAKVLGADERLSFGKWRMTWRCRNTSTGREIIIRSAQRFRSEFRPKADSRCEIMLPELYTCGQPANWRVEGGSFKPHNECEQHKREIEPHVMAGECGDARFIRLDDAIC